MINEKNLLNSLSELITAASTKLPKDVVAALETARDLEEKGSNAEYALSIITENIAIAKKEKRPICQDTGTIIVKVAHAPGMDQTLFRKVLCEAIVTATEKGILRQNSVETISGKNTGNNLGIGHPAVKFYQDDTLHNEVRIGIMLKGGGSENVCAQYSLPDTGLGAGRDLEGVRKVLLDSVFKAQGKGCGPGILGICIGGDRSTGYSMAKNQFFRKLDDVHLNPEIAKLEKQIVEDANKLNIGPMGFGGRTTILGAKICEANRLPASYFVTIAYMCWAFRRKSVVLNLNSIIKKWV